ncbi:hypothetical protein JTB14_000708 [Gonioctena quinquepunctata]|nr:hypothetical protein JTB14_000708 [Gonioctena quinquepunctata]
MVVVFSVSPIHFRIVFRKIFLPIGIDKMASLDVTCSEEQEQILMGSNCPTTTQVHMKNNKSKRYEHDVSTFIIRKRMVPFNSNYDDVPGIWVADKSML